MNTPFKRLITATRGRVARLRHNSEDGFGTIEWIFLIIGVLVLAGIVIAAVTAFVNGQIAQLPG